MLWLVLIKVVSTVGPFESKFAQFFTTPAVLLKKNVKNCIPRIKFASFNYLRSTSSFGDFGD